MRRTPIGLSVSLMPDYAHYSRSSSNVFVLVYGTDPITARSAVTAALSTAQRIVDAANPVLRRHLPATPSPGFAIPENGGSPNDDGELGPVEVNYGAM